MFSQSRQKLKQNAANFITLTNLSLGSFATFAIINKQPKIAILLIFLAAMADRFDGAVARKFEIESELGKQLDSLCDLISFGVAPALLVYLVALNELGPWGMFFTAFFIACGAFRLARFNVTPANGYFIGIPIPVTACILAFFALFSNNLSPLFFMVLTGFLGFAMVSTIKLKKI